MTLIKSISGIRGTIGGQTGDTLNPLDIVKFVTAYATFIRKSGKSDSNTIVVGRDARISGEMVRSVVCGTLIGMGYDVYHHHSQPQPSPVERTETAEQRRRVPHKG